MDFQIKKASNSTLTLKCPPEVIDDFIFILERLLMMSKILKNRVHYMEAERKGTDTALIAPRQAAFNKKALKTYEHFISLQNNGLSRSEAIKALRTELKEGYYEIELYITQGRRLKKEKRAARIREQHLSGWKTSELAVMHGMTYNTVKKIIESVVSAQDSTPSTGISGRSASL